MHRFIVLGIVAAVATGCGKTTAPVEQKAKEPTTTARAPKMQLVGSGLASVAPSDDGRTATFSLTPTGATGNVNTHIDNTVKLFSSPQVLTLGGAFAPDCSGATLSVPVTVQSYYADQLRNVTVMFEAITGTGHNLCNGDDAPTYLPGGVGYYAYGELDSYAAHNVVHQNTVTWALGYTNATPFNMTYWVYAELWPPEPVVTVPMDGGLYRVDPPVDGLWVGNTDDNVPALDVTKLQTVIYNDAGLTDPVANSGLTFAKAAYSDGNGNWVIYPNGPDALNPNVPLVDGNMYYITIHSMGLDRTGTEITGSMFAQDSFRYADFIGVVSPVGSTTGNAEFVYQGSAERLRWTSSVGSTSSKFWVYRCNNQTTCNGRGSVIASYNGTTVAGGGDMSAAVTAPALTDNTFYRWTAEQFFGADSGGATNDQIFKFFTGTRP